ncbi:MAG: tRNA adenosine(34) deaminase TadA [Gammaproteobacteria bacterium]|nr:tRNA adenosine(34) deaminase TadA [Gammaproteobacteria bacterium]
MGVATSDEAWMQTALLLAREAGEIGEVPVGAIVVSGGDIVGRGFNQMIMTDDPTAHAEIVALRQAAQTLGNYRLTGSSMFVTIEPCSMCAGAMIHARIETLHFAAREPRAGAAGSSIDVFANPGVNHRVDVMPGLCEAEASELMTQFFKVRRS